MFWPTDEVKDYLFAKYGEPKFIVEGYEKFMRHTHWQKASLVGEIEHWPIVYTTLGSFPNLVSIELEDEWFFGEDVRSTDDTMNYTSFGELLAVGTPLRRSWNLFHLTPTWCSRSQRTWLQPPDSIDAMQNFDTVTSLLQNTAKPITNLTIDTAFLPAMALSATIVGDRLSGFAGLRSLFLNIHSVGASYDAILGLPRILEAASGLIHLMLVLPGDDELNPMQSYTLEDVFPAAPVAWNSMQSFKIRNLSADAVGLTRLLRFSMRNISHLELGNIELTSGAWEEVMEYLHRQPRLSRFRVWRGCGLLYPGFPHRKMLKARGSLGIYKRDEIGACHQHRQFLADIEDYIIHGGRNPCLAMELPAGNCS
ncbi:MAG: hypothetical protein Q9213_005652 [Squamulea squamosa]